MFRNDEVACLASFLPFQLGDLGGLRTVPDYHGGTDLITHVFALVSSSHVRLVAATVDGTVLGHRCVIILPGLILERTRVELRVVLGLEPS